MAGLARWITAKLSQGPVFGNAPVSRSQVLSAVSPMQIARSASAACGSNAWTATLTATQRAARTSAFALTIVQRRCATTQHGGAAPSRLLPSRKPKAWNAAIRMPIARPVAFGKRIPTATASLDRTTRARWTHVLTAFANISAIPSSVSVAPGIPTPRAMMETHARRKPAASQTASAKEALRLLQAAVRPTTTVRPVLLQAYSRALRTSVSTQRTTYFIVNLIGTTVLGVLPKSASRDSTSPSPWASFLGLTLALPPAGSARGAANRYGGGCAPQ